jgi:hypothetical protein
MSKLSSAVGAIMLCLGLLFSANMVRATQEQSPKADKAQKKEQKVPEQKKADPGDQKNSETVTLTGKVTATTDASVTFVDDQKAEHTVAVTTDTKVTKGGKDAALSDIKADDVVTVVAKKGAADALMAVQIDVS